MFASLGCEPGGASNSPGGQSAKAAAVRNRCRPGPARADRLANGVGSGKDRQIETGERGALRIGPLVQGRGFREQNAKTCWHFQDPNRDQ